MTNQESTKAQTSTKVRLVRCPKCRQVLAELPEVTLYKCGGCGTILEAKKRKLGTSQTEQALETKESVVNAQHDEALGENEARSNGVDMNCQAGEVLSNNVECEGEHRSSSSVSNGSSTSPYVSCNDSEDSTISRTLPVGHTSPGKAEERNGSVEFSGSGEGKESTTEDTRKQDECMNHQDEYLGEKEPHSHEFSYPARALLLHRTEENCDDEHGDSHVELKEGSSDSNRLSTSPEVNCGEGEGSPEQNSLGSAVGQRGLDEILSSPEEKLPSAKEDTRKQDEDINQDIRQDHNVGEESQREPQEGDSSYEPNHRENDSPLVVKGETTQITPAYRDGDLFAEITQDELQCSSVEIVSHENGDASPNVELRVQVYGDDDDTDEDLGTLDSPRTEKESPQIGSDWSIITAVGPVTPDKDPSTLKSPRTEEERKGSADNPIPPQITTKGSIVDQVDSVSPESGHHLAGHRGSVSSVDTLESSPPDVQLGIKNFEMTNSSISQNYYGYDGSESSCDGTDDQVQEHTPRPSRRKSNDVGQPHISTREVPVKYRLRPNDTVNSDQEMNRRRPISSSILQERQHHSMKDKYVEPERLPFISREFEADHRSSNPVVHHHNRLPPHPGFQPKGKHSYSVPDKMDLLRTVCELKDQLDRMQFPKRLPTRVVNERPPPHYYDHLPPEMELYGNSYHRRAERFNHHGPPFSGEVAHYRHPVSCSCLKCYPQDRCYSAQLPPHSTFLSSSSSPQQYLSSEMSSWGQETSFDNQRQRDEEVKRLYLREKYHTAKRNLRPIAGGAPVLTCYHCSELLLLPEDFLLFDNKRYHQLRCNACKKVLKLSRRERTHIVPYVSDSAAPPPSEAGPVLLSDEYGRSYNRYPSMGRDPSTTLPQNGVVQQQKDRKMKSAMKEPHSKSKSLMGTTESAGPSSKEARMRKPASEIDERPALHRLMGYTSPSQVFEK